jgi:RimJ/RimL family protein N-acetyltransferase
MTPPAPIDTPRLRLDFFSVSDWQHFALGGDESPPDCPWRISDRVVLPGAPLARLRLSQLQRNSGFLPWMPRAIVHREDNTLIGGINLHHAPPDPDLQPWTPHGVEFGYDIAPAYQRSGYATEAIHGLLVWACQQARVDDVILCIAPDNHPSIALAQSLGFEHIDAVQDPDDGEEHVWRAPAEVVLQRAADKLQWKHR